MCRFSASDVLERADIPDGAYADGDEDQIIVWIDLDEPGCPRCMDQGLPRFTPHVDEESTGREVPKSPGLYDSELGAYVATDHHCALGCGEWIEPDWVQVSGRDSDSESEWVAAVETAAAELLRAQGERIAATEDETVQLMREGLQSALAAHASGLTPDQWQRLKSPALPQLERVAETARPSLYPRVCREQLRT